MQWQLGRELVQVAVEDKQHLKQVEPRRSKCRCMTLICWWIYQKILQGRPSWRTRVIAKYICMHVNELHRFFKSRNVINNPHGSLLLHPKEDQPNNNATLLRDICHHLDTRGSMHGICFRVSQSRKTFRRCRVGFSSLRFGNWTRTKLWATLKCINNWI